MVWYKMTWQQLIWCTTHLVVLFNAAVVVAELNDDVRASVRCDQMQQLMQIPVVCMRSIGLQ